MEKFTNHLKAALTRALCLVLETGGEAISPAHLLWAVGTEQGSMGAEILAKAGMKSEELGKLVGATSTFAPMSGNVAHATPFLSEDAKKAIEKAILSASVHEHRYIGTEHLLFGIMQTSAPEVVRFLEKQRITKDTLEEHLRAVFTSTTVFPQSGKMEIKPENIQPCEECGELHEKHPEEEKSATEYFTVELTNPDRVKKIDVLVGREEEVDRLGAILSRRTKNNPLLLGEPGVGKTAIVEGLARRIVEKNAPTLLLDKKIFMLDMASLVAGTMYRGDFEARLTDLLEEFKEHTDRILFIDEIHTIIGAGSATGTLDAANMLKPALARGEIRCIGATTNQEYKKHIEADGALARRFATVPVREPSAEETLKILEGLAPQYAAHHHVRFTDKALRTIITLSERYFPHKTFPDKAIDLMDEAGSHAGDAKARRHAEKRVTELKTALKETEGELKKAVSAERFPDAVELKRKEDALKKELLLLEKRTVTPATSITEEIIQKIASRVSGVPLEKLSEHEHEALLTLEKRLSDHVIAQTEAVNAVADAVRRAKLGFAHEDRPLASFLFIGPSGVGKTELAKALAQEVFGDQKSLIRLDMSEYAEPHSVSKLVGSPAGYVGYREGTKLTDAVKAKPYSVILFDELEKAHRDVHNLLLQILDEGSLTDASGTSVNFRNTIIVLTTNAGRELFERGALGFGEKHRAEKESIRSVLEDSFKPELLNRINRVCVFTRLLETDLQKIVDKELRGLAKRLGRRGIHFRTNASTLKLLAKAVNPKLGARDVRRVIEEQIEKPLADKVLAHIKRPKHAYAIRATKTGKITIA